MFRMLFICVGGASASFLRRSLRDRFSGVSAEQRLSDKLDLRSDGGPPRFETYRPTQDKWMKLAKVNELDASLIKEIVFGQFTFPVADGNIKSAIQKVKRQNKS